MDSLEDWDSLVHRFITKDASPDLFLPNHCSYTGIDGIDSSTLNFVSQEKEFAEVDDWIQKETPDAEGSRKRSRGDSCCRPGTKACRERLRREKLNERFLDLSSILEPGRPVKTDKPAIIDDAIRVLTQLRNEAQELKETNEKLQEDIKVLKAEKNELREEKLVLKAEKERMELQLKPMTVPSAGFLPAHSAAYHTAANKMAVFPAYSLVPMWQYLPPTERDTSNDHELRPPAA
ncbi:hypothetical protein SLE2022_168230 [Rubroshorea leprosula]